MNGMVSWVLIGAAGLLSVAIVVAWWEHLGRNVRRSDGALPVSQPEVPRVLTVDLSLDALAAPAAEGDAATRRETLDGALGRMTQAGSSADARRAWLDTSPMIAAGMHPEVTPRDTSSAGLN